jgi:hypothetical protein
MPEVDPAAELHATISLLAYDFWQQRERGEAHGDTLNDWLMAEKIILAEINALS